MIDIHHMMDMMEFWNNHTLQHVQILSCSFRSGFWSLKDNFLKKNGPIDRVAVKFIHTVNAEYAGT